jgi:hypothetical protein
MHGQPHIRFKKIIVNQRFQQHWLEGRESSERDTVSSTRGHEDLRGLGGSIFNVEASEDEK